MPPAIGILATIVFAAVLGAVLGSFANVVIVRFHRAASLWGRSRCPFCESAITMRDLVPIVSWIVLGGKCRHCSRTIHWQYPVVEALSIVLAVIAALRHSPFGSEAPLFFVELVFMLALVVIVGMDLRWKELPVEIMAGVGLIALGLRLGVALRQGDMAIASTSIGLALAVAVAFFGGQWLVSGGRWLGSGDVWFGAMTALVLGWPLTGMAMIAAYIVGGLVVTILFIAGLIQRDARIPFAPALAAGLLIAMWFGERI